MKIELIIKNTIYINPYDKDIQEDLRFYLDGSLVNHKDYLDYTSKHIDYIRFNSYEKALTFFNETYGELMELEHWMDEDEDGNLIYVGWDRYEDFNVDLSVEFCEVE